MTTKNSINIQGTTPNIDPFYRYKMEQVIISQLKNKIAFENINQIAKDLCRDPIDILKFIKTHYGSAFEYKNGVALTTKTITRDEMQNAIYIFIEKYVLCKKCKNPETIIENNKKKYFTKCLACSFYQEI